MGYVSEGPLGVSGGDRFHDDRGVDEGWPSHLLPALRDEGSHPSRGIRWVHRESDSAVDETDRPESDGSVRRIPWDGSLRIDGS